ncbi:MAG: hypothetical protein CSA68_12700 [Rhodobacterales bacterium]|nr:MAG: hypothetical protein CSA68_12700 [Rhodobacterales bacterium]
MTVSRPHKTWWTATEIAEANLPDMPGTRKGVDLLAKRSGWRSHPNWSRQRSGKGGGWEYSWELFPTRARRILLKQSAPKAVAETKVDLHAYYEALPDRIKKKAQERKRVLDLVLTLERDGLPRDEAVQHGAAEAGVSARTIWNWFKLVSGAAGPSEWLYHLAPRHRAGGCKKAKAKCSKAFFDLLKADYLRVDGGSFSASYLRAVEWCKANGKAFLTERTARRRMNEEVPRVTQVFAREGEAGLMCIPTRY